MPSVPVRLLSAVSARPSLHSAHHSAKHPLAPVADLAPWDPSLLDLRHRDLHQRLPELEQDLRRVSRSLVPHPVWGQPRCRQHQLHQPPVLRLASPLPLALLPSLRPPRRRPWPPLAEAALLPMLPQPLDRPVRCQPVQRLLPVPLGCLLSNSSHQVRPRGRRRFSVPHPLLLGKRMAGPIFPPPLLNLEDSRWDCMAPSCIRLAFIINVS